jgi:hypothetical protein
VHGVVRVEDGHATAVDVDGAGQRPVDTGRPEDVQRDVVAVHPLDGLDAVGDVGADLVGPVAGHDGVEGLERRVRLTDELGDLLRRGRTVERRRRRTAVQTEGGQALPQPRVQPRVRPELDVGIVQAALPPRLVARALLRQLAHLSPRWDTWRTRCTGS